jgi:UbiD family decarboxylase
MAFNDLREFIEAARKLGDVEEIHGATWDLEIGALTELSANRADHKLLLFDEIPGHQPSYRVASNLVNHPRRIALASGMPTDLPKTEMVLRWRKSLQSLKPIPPKVVGEGPILQNSKSGADIDMTLFPALCHHHRSR